MCAMRLTQRPSTRRTSSDFALAIEHRTFSGLIVVDFVTIWTGSSSVPLQFELVCQDIANILGRYGINTVQGDQYGAAVIQQEFLKLGITYRQTRFGGNTRAQIFNNLKHLIQQRRIELLDKPELLRQLRTLEERRSADGNVDVRADRGQKDDIAVVVALAALELSGSAFDAPRPVILGHMDRPWEGQLPQASQRSDPYPVVQICGKFPNCWDANDCECCGIEKG